MTDQISVEETPTGCKSVIRADNTGEVVLVILQSAMKVIANMDAGVELNILRGLAMTMESAYSRNIADVIYIITDVGILAVVSEDVPQEKIAADESIARVRLESDDAQSITVRMLVKEDHFVLTIYRGNRLWDILSDEV